MSILLEYLSTLPSYKRYLMEKPKCISKANDSGIISLILTKFIASEKSMIVVIPTLFQAQKYYEAMCEILTEEDEVLFFPADDLITMEMFISSDELMQERIHTLESSFDHKKHLIITNYTGAIRKEFSKEIWEKSFLKLCPGDTISFTFLEQTLVRFGYHRVFTVSNQGEFSIRGSIIDFFPYTETTPIRLDFFDDEIEKIKAFDSQTQLSNKELDHVWIHPLTELIYEEEDLKEFNIQAEKFLDGHIFEEEEKNKYLMDFDSIRSHTHIESLLRYIELFQKETNTIFDFFVGEVVLVDETKLFQQEKKAEDDIISYCENIKGYSICDLKYFSTLKKIFKVQNSVTKFEGLNTIFNEESYIMDIRDLLPFRGDQSSFVNEMEKLYYKNVVILSIPDDFRIQTVKDALREKDIYTKIIRNPNEIKKGIVNIVKEPFVSMDLVSEQTYIYNSETIFRAQSIERPGRFKHLAKNAIKLSSIHDLHIGDYVVHYDRGIGRYLGLKTLELSGIKRDYIQIQYAGDDMLYIPIEQFKKIQKYSGSEGSIPRLTKLGTAQWEIQKRKVKEKAKNISAQLIQLYAAREMSKGLQSLPDTEEQLQFESDFKYDATADQIKIIQDVKKDMESTKPMDRLVCGDVGYGKTEIALRAAFKSVMSGYQVAYLCPTTVLAKQHYQTFKNRFEKYGARIEILSRYNTTKEIHQILKDLEKGSIDILIGTHRILSKDVKFKNLGLLIIDEEQRFGVVHKERIKEMKVNVDSLTLTATPIPRTMQMAIMGIKDLSTLETPPKNRYPIQTYVLERNKSIIKEAIERELLRHGQVFYLYNRVEDIDSIASDIQKLVPQARVCYAHGKMNKGDLEKIIDDFTNYEYDVLVSTTIIETGIDIPNSNTLMVHNADLLGLSQLYQLRGRVGRSDRVAYAYLMYDGNKKLTSTAEERLSVIKEFTELGSGFKIAMRDLNIRGAGDILGSDQSGFIDSVGLEMYLKILEETIQEEKGIEKKEEKEPREIGKVLYSRSISKEYIEDDDTRIDIHRKIDALAYLKDYTALYKELCDRFGKPSVELTTYMKEKLLKAYMNRIGFDNLTLDTRMITLYMSKSSTTKYKPDDLFMVAAGISRDFSFHYENNCYLIHYSILRDSNWMMTVISYLDKIESLSQ